MYLILCLRDSFSKDDSIRFDTKFLDLTKRPLPTFEYKRRSKIQEGRKKQSTTNYTVNSEKISSKFLKKISDNLQTWKIQSYDCASIVPLDVPPSFVFVSKK